MSDVIPAEPEHSQGVCTGQERGFNKMLLGLGGDTGQVPASKSHRFGFRVKPVGVLDGGQRVIMSVAARVGAPLHP